MGVEKERYENENYFVREKVLEEKAENRRKEAPGTLSVTEPLESVILEVT